MTTQNEELAAQVAELEAMLADVPDEMREVLQQQIAAARQAMQWAEAIEPVELQRVELTEDEQRFFAPLPLPELPAWIDDDVCRDQVDDEMLRCPPEARIYETDSSIGCAIPADVVGGVPNPHGLTLGFHSSGNLAYQRYYEQGLLRWAIEYYVTGGRESQGYFCDTEPKVHLEEGVFTRFAPNGQIIAQTEYQNGVQEGWARCWEDDGTPIVATQYRNGLVEQEVLPGVTARHGDHEDLPAEDPLPDESLADEPLTDDVLPDADR